MPGKKTNKQRRKEMRRRKQMAAGKLTKVDMIRVGKSTDRGQKW